MLVVEPRQPIPGPARSPSTIACGRPDPVRPDVELLRPDQRHLPAAGVAPRGVMELDNIDAAKQMVVAGLGVALLPQTAVASELR